MTARIRGLVKSGRNRNTRIYADIRADSDGKQEELAKKAGIGLATVQRLERGSGPLMAHVSTAVKIEAALNKAGIRFIESNAEGGLGVQLKR